MGEKERKAQSQIAAGPNLSKCVIMLTAMCLTIAARCGIVVGLRPRWEMGMGGGDVRELRPKVAELLSKEERDRLSSARSILAQGGAKSQRDCSRSPRDGTSHLDQAPNRSEAVEPDSSESLSTKLREFEAYAMKVDE